MKTNYLIKTKDKFVRKFYDNKTRINFDPTADSNNCDIYVILSRTAKMGRFMEINF